MRLPRSKLAGADTPHLGRHDINAPLRAASAESRSAAAHVDAVSKAHDASQIPFEGAIKAAQAEANSLSDRSRFQYQMSESDRQYKNIKTQNFLKLVQIGTSLASRVSAQNAATKKATVAAEWDALSQESANEVAFNALQTKENVATAADMVTKYTAGIDMLKQGLEQDQFRSGPGGTIMDNSDIIQGNYLKAADTLKDEFLSGIESPQVREAFLKSAGEVDLKSQVSLSATQWKWTNETAEIKISESIDSAMRSGDFVLAKQTLELGAVSGSIPSKEIPKWNEKIRIGSTNKIYRDQLGNATNPLEIASIRDQLELPAFQGHTQTARDQLKKEANLKIRDFYDGLAKDYLSEGLTSTTDKIKQLSAMDPADLGFEDGTTQKTTINHMKAVMNNAVDKVTMTETELDHTARMQEIGSGRVVDVTSNKDMKAYDGVFENIATQMNGGEPAEPFSGAWLGALGQVSVGNSKFPTQASKVIKAYVDDPNPENVMKVAGFVNAVSQAMPQHMKNVGLTVQDKTFLNRINDLSNAGAPPADLVDNIRAETYAMNDAVMDERKAAHKVIAGADGFYEDFHGEAIDQLGGEYEYGNFVNKKLQDEGGHALNVLYDYYYMQTGDEATAKQEAIGAFRTAYKPSDRMGGSIVGPDSPEAMNPHIPPADINREVNYRVRNIANNEGKIDAEQIKLHYAGKNAEGKNQWSMTLQEDGLIRVLYDDAEGNNLSYVTFNQGETQANLETAKEAAEQTEIKATALQAEADHANLGNVSAEYVKTLRGEANRLKAIDPALLQKFLQNNSVYGVPVGEMRDLIKKWKDS